MAIKSDPAAPRGIRPGSVGLICVKSVLYVNYYASPVSTRLLDGVFRFAHEKRWNVQVIDKVSESALRGLIDFWRPVGCLYGANDGLKPDLLRAIGKLPLVLLDGDPAYVHPGASSVCHDPAEAAQTVARKFLEMGLRNFAFCGYKGFYHWTESRAEEFHKALALNGRLCTDIWIDPSDAENDGLRQALRGLPRPCGIFVANDDIGRRVLGACRLTRLSVPKDIAVIGVDNDEHICENTKPTLTSILPAHEQAGYDGAGLLAELIAGGEPRRLRFGVRLCVQRGSTQEMRVAEPRVRAARTFISANVHRPLAVTEVAAQMACTPRMAEILFRRACGRTIKDEIADARIDLAKRLLANRKLGISAIASMCGYENDASLRRIFLAKVGCSMSEWRRRPIG